MTELLDAGPCPDDNALSALVAGRAVPTALEHHIERCASCRAVLAAVGRGLASDSSPGRAFVRKGEQIDRYVVRRELGRGGMGVVLEAEDTALQRRVALKVLHDPADGSVAIDEQLMREGQAIARLEHPNIVRVYDIGVDRGRWFIALELVRGPTLAEWTRTPRAWPAIVDVFVGCAQGLAAAHAAGVVHRDFKPSNVLLGPGPKVTDFGLATEATQPTDPAADPGHITSNSTLMGTPGYVAPELADGARASPASDQFALCVSLYTALHGERPFVGRTPAHVLAAMRDGAPAAGASRRTIPRWLHAAVCRGLLPDPGDRWPSMTALAAALQRPARRWRPRAIAVGVAAAAAAALTLGAASDVQPECDDGRGRWDAVSNAQTRHALDEVLAASEFTVGSRDSVRTQLNALEQRWRAVAASTCDVAPTVAARRRLCLDGTLSAVDAATATLLAGGVAAHGVELVAAIPAPDRCLDDRSLASEPAPPPPALAHRVADIRAEIAQAKALLKSGRLTEAGRVATRAAVAARTVPYPPLVPEAEYRRGSIVAGQGKHADAVPILEAAFFAAQRSGHSRVAATTAALLAATVGYHLARPDDGAAWARHADVELRRAEHSAEVRAAVRSAWGSLLAKDGEYEQALEHQRRGAEILVEAHGPDHLLLAKIWGNVGNTLRAAGDYEQSLAHHRRSLAISRRWLGDKHPDVGYALINAGTVLYHLERYDEAIDALRPGLSIVREALGAEHPAVATAYNSLAIAHADRGDAEQAVRYHEQAIALRRKVLGEDHPTLGMSYFNLGRAQHAQGLDAEALRNYRRGTATIEAAMGPTHPYLATSLAHEADLLFASGDAAAALPLYERAHAIAGAHLDRAHPTWAQTTAGLAAARAALSHAGGEPDVKTASAGAPGLRVEPDLGP